MSFPMIRSMGFVDYFLIVWDYVKFAKDHDIIVVRGGVRQPVLVSYTSASRSWILKYNLILNVSESGVSRCRISMSISCFEHRQDVIDYASSGNTGKTAPSRSLLSVRWRHAALSATWQEH